MYFRKKVEDFSENHLMVTLIWVSRYRVIVGNGINNQLAITGTEVEISDMLQNVTLVKFDIIH